jgi:hypothetical protein
MVYAGEYYYSPEQQKAMEEARQQAIKDKHDKKLESLPDGGMGGPDRSKLKTHFMTMGIPALRSMILDADPNRIYEVSQHWKSVHNTLSGGDGDAKSGGVDQVSAKDSVAGMMQSAVENVLQHWEGDAAEAFRKRANQITQNIQSAAAWANYYGETMHSVQNDLRNSMEKMRDVHEPSAWDRAWDKVWDDDRSDEQFLKDINKGVSTDAARQANADSLSAGKEAQLKGVAIMEQLAFNYQSYTDRGSFDKGGKDPYSPPNPHTPMPPPIAMPPAGGTGPGTGGRAPKPWNAGPTMNVKPTTDIKPTPTVPRNPGITGGPKIPTAKTNIDSLSPGLTGSSSGMSSGGLSSGGGGIGTTGASGPGIVAPAGGVGGSAAGRGGIGGVGARGGVTGGGAAAGRGAGGRAGMGGLGSGAGAAGRGGAGAGGRGALARARGGVVGEAKGVGKGAGGGAGLHGSRGGTQRGGKAGAMAGGAGGRNGRRSEEENSQGERPDYLVEDEETWISEEDRNRNVPRTIE